MNDRLYRSRDERMIAGVAGGIAERYDFDPSLVRIVWAILILVTGGLFLLIYIVMAIVIPDAPMGADGWPDWGGAPAAGAVPGWDPPAASGAGAAFAATTGPGGEPPAGPGAGTTPSTGADPNTPAPGTDPSSTTPFTSSDPTTSPSATPPPSMLAGGYTPPSSAGQAPGSPPPWAVPPPRHRRRDRSGSGAIIGGIVLVLVGGYFLLRQFAPQLQLGSAWPIVLVIIGFALVLGAFRPGSGRGDGG